MRGALAHSAASLGVTQPVLPSEASDQAELLIGSYQTQRTNYYSLKIVKGKFHSFCLVNESRVRDARCAAVLRADR